MRLYSRIRIDRAERKVRFLRNPYSAISANFHKFPQISANFDRLIDNRLFDRFLFSVASVSFFLLLPDSFSAFPPDLPVYILSILSIGLPTVRVVIGADPRDRCTEHRDACFSLKRVVTLDMINRVNGIAIERYRRSSREN